MWATPRMCGRGGVCAARIVAENNSAMLLALLANFRENRWKHPGVSLWDRSTARRDRLHESQVSKARPHGMPGQAVAPFAVSLRSIFDRVWVTSLKAALASG